MGSFNQKAAEPMNAHIRRTAAVPWGGRGTPEVRRRTPHWRRHGRRHRRNGEGKPGPGRDAREIDDGKLRSRAELALSANAALRSHSEGAWLLGKPLPCASELRGHGSGAVVHRIRLREAVPAHPQLHLRGLAPVFAKKVRSVIAYRVQISREALSAPPRKLHRQK